GVVGSFGLDRDLVGDLFGQLGFDRVFGGLLGLLLGDRVIDDLGEDRHLRVGQVAQNRHLAGVEARQRLMLGQAAVGRAGDRRVRAATAVRQDRHAAAVEGLVALVLDVGFLGGELRLRLDVDAPAGEAGGEAGVLAIAADRQRELVVGHDHGRLALVVVDDHLAYPRRAQGFGDEAGGLLVVRDDVDLLAAELGDDHADARAARADAGADRVDPVGVGDDGDLRAVTGLAGDADDFDQAVGDLRDLQLEQRFDQLRAAARDDDRRAFGRVGD